MIKNSKFFKAKKQLLYRFSIDKWKVFFQQTELTRNWCYWRSSSYDNSSGATDVHRLMITVVETNFTKPELRKPTNQNYDYCNASSNRVWMTHVLRSKCAYYNNFENRFVIILDEHTYLERGCTISWQTIHRFTIQWCTIHA